MYCSGMPAPRGIRGTGLILLLMVLFSPPASGGENAPLVLELSTQASEPYRKVLEAFRAQLRTGEPDAQFYYHLIGDDKSLPAAPFALEKRPSLIFALGTRAIAMARETFPTTPLVATMILNGKQEGQEAPYAAITLRIPPAIHLYWLAKFVPSARRVGILYDPEQSSDLLAAFQQSSEGTGLEIVPVKVNSPGQLQRGLQDISRQADVLLAIPDATVYSGKTAKEVLLFSYRHRIPFVGLSSTWVEAGALYALEADYTFIGHQCAQSARQILTGDPPVAPSLANDNVTFTINSKTARHLRLDIDAELLANGLEVFR
ncbi:MAG: hypothetical protein C4563_11450 [Desulfobulbus sp.]|nr:MAG: hypothetical protein C4563_11450 [Desulfobulbus sp.]